MKRYSIVLFVAALSTIMISCDKDDPTIPNPEELITTLTYTLTPVDGGDDVVFSFQDLDGDGGDEPIIINGVLSQYTNYTGTLVLLNETESPVENITEEIIEEDEDHQFFFQSDLAGVFVTYTDKDEDDNPVGVNTILSSGLAESGDFTIILRHEPSKDADGVADGIITNAGGETDIEVTFSLSVQ